MGKQLCILPLYNPIVDEEIERLRENWCTKKRPDDHHGLPVRMSDYLDQTTLAEMDYFEQIKIAGIINVCQKASSMAEAGRVLFNYSRTQKSSQNDSHRLKQILARYGLSFDMI